LSRTRDRIEAALATPSDEAARRRYALLDLYQRATLGDARPDAAPSAGYPHHVAGAGLPPLGAHSGRRAAHGWCVAFGGQGGGMESPLMAARRRHQLLQALR